jgi:hypothetical protein
MRKDMSKVIVERPRRGGKYVRKGRDVQDPDMLISHEGMRMPYVRNYNNKELNENLAPLLRFLQSRVGHLWDHVWSEISENIRASNAVQQHVRDHVVGYVETKTRLDQDGKVWCCDSRPRLLENSTYVRFYVHPQTGILCVNPSYRNWKNSQKEYKQRQEEEKFNTQRDLPDGVHLRKSKGIWYSVEMLPIPPEVKIMVYPKIGAPYERVTGGSAYDVILDQTLYLRNNQVWSMTTRNWVRGSNTYCASKRQLSHTELKKYGVEND